ncbi:hypothetical protein [Enterobacter kobei]|uniref:hypothetical protein n=1 Tax=Enterobacter kobei TaxID=208224 RepID=UPI003CF9E5B7
MSKPLYTALALVTGSALRPKPAKVNGLTRPTGLVGSRILSQPVAAGYGSAIVR